MLDIYKDEGVSGAAVDEDDYPQVRQLLREVVSGYKPEGEIVDWIYQQRRGEPARLSIAQDDLRRDSKSRTG